MVEWIIINVSSSSCPVCKLGNKVFQALRDYFMLLYWGRICSSSFPLLSVPAILELTLKIINKILRNIILKLSELFTLLP